MESTLYLSSVNILIVEDSFTQAEHLRFILEDNGFTIRTAGNGAEALQLIQQQIPTLVITDINMPLMDGYELCRAIRSHTIFKSIPVILLTSLYDPKDVFTALECGADSFITKPYHEESLVKQIRVLLSGSQFRYHQMGSKSITFSMPGSDQPVSADIDRIMNLLMTTYSAAVEKNRQLAAVHDDLMMMNEKLEEMVAERTASLEKEIEEGKRAAKRIAEQAALLDKAQDSIVVIDLNGCPLFWNKGAERIFGWSSEEILLNAVPEIAQSFIDFKDLLLENEEWSGDIEAHTKDKKKIILETRANLLKDEQGNPVSLLAISTDITEKKKIEEQFIRSQRMESIGTLAAGIAHDLNNILTPILMSIDILRSSDDPQLSNEILDTIETSTRRGSEVVRQVLSFARGVDGKRTEVNPKFLIKEIEPIIRETFPKIIHLNISIPKDVWTVLADPTQLHQVLLNLCINSRDAMPNGGTLTIETENRVLDKQYVAMNPQARIGQYVVVSVIDTGTGISAKNIDRIFEPFFTTKELGKGTGLGLPTVIAIVKGHGGFLNVYSEIGKGSKFSIHLPAVKTSIDNQKTPQAIPVFHGNNETILLVDDEEAILHITAQTLTHYGYKVLTAKNGAEALRIYAENQSSVDVVLTDINMPILDGFATIQSLFHMNSEVKIIAASGLNSNGGESRMKELGIKHFVVKPYTAAAILKEIHLILGGSEIPPDGEYQ